MAFQRYLAARGMELGIYTDAGTVLANSAAAAAAVVVVVLVVVLVRLIALVYSGYNRLV